MRGRGPRRHEDYAGRKTSVRIQNMERIGRVEGDSKDTLYVLKGYNFNLPTTGPHSVGKRVAVLSPQFSEYSKYYWWFNTNSDIFPKARFKDRPGRVATPPHTPRAWNPPLGRPPTVALVVRLLLL